MFIPEPTLRTTLLVNVTSWTADQGAPPSSFLGVSWMAKPAWDDPQFCSNTLPAMSTRLAFLSSSKFFTVQPCDRHASGLKKLLPVISMSEGTRPETEGSAPPNITFSPDPS